MHKVSLASKANLPSVGVTHPHDVSDLYKEVFNFMLDTVNKQPGVAWYNSQDQAFSLHKQVRFEDGTNSPDLDHNTSSGPAMKVSTPYHSTSNLNHTFNISQILPFVSGTQQNAVTIVAEVSAAAAAKASKELCHMCEPKITKLKGGIQWMRNWYFTLGVWISWCTSRIAN